MDDRQAMRELIARFPYRLDTNFAKMDRIVHREIETFKERVHATRFHGMTIGAWNRLLSRGDENLICQALARHFDIRDVGTPVVE